MKDIKRALELIEDAKIRKDEYVILTIDAIQMDMLLLRGMNYICCVHTGEIALTWLSSIEDLNRLRNKIKNETRGA
jgi:hypothetical protein